MKKTGKIKNVSLFVNIFLIILILLINISFISASDYQVKVTKEHPFLLSSGNYIPAGELQVGDELKTVNGKKVRITSIKEIIPDEPILVYNLEALPFNDFVVAGGVVVHNSNQPATQKPTEIYEYNWGENSARLIPGESTAGMIERIEIDSVEPQMQADIINIFKTTLGNLNIRNGKVSVDSSRLKIEALKFTLKMSDRLPFLGKKNFEAFYPSRDICIDNKPFFYEYLKQSEGGKVPKLSELTKSGNMDCTVQVLAIKNVLENGNFGEWGQGWELRRAYTGRGIDRPHTFLAKKVTTLDGKEYYAIIDPAEPWGVGNVPKTSLMPAEEVDKLFPKICFKTSP